MNSHPSTHNRLGCEIDMDSTGARGAIGLDWCAKSDRTYRIINRQALRTLLMSAASQIGPFDLGGSPARCSS
jgi:hypothetical protein